MRRAILAFGTFGALAAVVSFAGFSGAKTDEGETGSATSYEPEGPSSASASASAPAPASASASASAPAPARLILAEKPLPDVGDGLGRLLAEPRYVFCHDENRPLRGDEDLCRFAGNASGAPRRNDGNAVTGAPATRCPGFEKACARVTPGDHEPRRFHIPDWLASITEFLFWAILVIGAGYFIYQIARHFQHGRAPQEAPDPVKKAVKEGQGEESVPASLRVVDKDAVRLLASARSALLAGDPRTAARLAHAALVRALESGGYVHVDKSATNGDYARALRERPELRDVFRAAAREVEQSEFGQQLPTVEKLAPLLARIEPVVQRLVMVALALGMALSSCACGPLEGSGDGPGGTSVLRRLLEERGATFERRTRPLQNLGDDEMDTVILLPSASLDEAAWTALRAWIQDGGFLVMAGAPPDAPGAFGIKGHKTKPCGKAPSVALEGPLEGAKLTSPLWPLDLDDTWISDVGCPEGAVIATREFGDGRLLVLSDPAFLTNASLSREPHARVVFTLLGAPGSVALVDRLIGAGAASPYRAVANSGLGPLLVHGLAWLVLWALATGTGFGTRRDPVAVPRRAFSEHVRAMGLLYARAGAARFALGAYSAWALDRLTTRLRAGERGRVLDLGSAIARITGRTEGSVARILAEAVDARERPDVAGMRGAETEDLATLAALDDIVRETGGYR